jgi:hypothetical protein
MFVGPKRVVPTDPEERARFLEQERLMHEAFLELDAEPGGFLGAMRRREEARKAQAKLDRAAKRLAQARKLAAEADARAQSGGA